MKRIMIAVALLSLALSAGCIEDIKGIDKNSPPTAIISYDKDFANTYETITFNGSESIDKDGSIIMYYWEFGDNESANGMNLTQVTHAYIKGGTYTVNLTVIDDDNAEGKTSITVTINELPVADIIVEFQGEKPKVNDAVTFSATNSTDIDGSIVDYYWEFGDGESDKGETVTHTYKKSGIYVVNLTVTDDDNANDTTSMAITIEMRKYSIEWREYSATEELANNALLLEGENDTYEESIKQYNITRIIFNLTWDDYVPPPDEFNISITNPDDIGKSMNSTIGTIEITFFINTLPHEEEYECDSEKEAFQYALELHPISEKGIGIWKVIVELLNADPIIDLQNTYSLEYTYYYYEAEIEEIG